MAFGIGVVLFAIAIGVSIGLHEWGHLTVAKWSGLLVRRSFIGFGPTLFSFKRGETEYGLKAIPLGGFCDIAGMTPDDPMEPADEQRAMWRQPWYKRIATLSGGIAMNFIIGVGLIYIVAAVWGLPNLHSPVVPSIGATGCVSQQVSETNFDQCEGKGPAHSVGLQYSDDIVAVNSVPVSTPEEVIKATQLTPGNTVDYTIRREDSEQTVTVPVERVQRWVKQSDGSLKPQTVAAVGITIGSRRTDPTLHYNALTAIPGSVSFTGELAVLVGKGLASFPGKIPGVVASIFGGERDAEGPMSVWGASRVGGELAENSLWAEFLLILAQLNLFLGAFNLIPLPPLDGGHIAVVLYERLRDLIRRLRGLAPAGPADYKKIAPLTIGVAVLLIGVGVIVIAADIVNPIKLF